MELNLEEQTLIAAFRNLDEPGKKELLRHASQQRKTEAEHAGLLFAAGQCGLDGVKPRPESVAEPIFTE